MGNVPQSFFRDFDIDYENSYKSFAQNGKKYGESPIITLLLMDLK